MKAALRILEITLVLICLADAIDYQLIMDEDGLFATCENQQGNPSNLDGLMDMSALKVINGGNKLNIEGELRVVWKNVQPGDTVKFVVQIFRLEKGTWQKTMFSIKSNNFCRNMFEKNQYWYEFWTQHINNSDEIKSKCLTTPGTVLKLEPYELELNSSLNVPNLEGRYKVVLQFEAFDKRYVKRPVSICTELRGTAMKL